MEPAPYLELWKVGRGGNILLITCASVAMLNFVLTLLK